MLTSLMIISRQSPRNRPSLRQGSHSHFGSHATLAPARIPPFFSCTYVEPILQPLCFHILACNGGLAPSSTFASSNLAIETTPEVLSADPDMLGAFRRIHGVITFMSYSCAL